MKHREIIIENKSIKKVIRLKVDTNNQLGISFLSSQLHASFDLTKTGRVSNRLWRIVSINNNCSSWEILGKDNDLIDFSFYSAQTGKNMFKKTRMDRNMLRLKLGFLGLKEISISNFRKTYNK